MMLVFRIRNKICEFSFVKFGFSNTCVRTNIIYLTDKVTFKLGSEL